MPVTMLDAVEFSKIPALNFVVPVVAADPTGYEAGFIYNSTSKQVKFHNGTGWVALGEAGSGGPPTGAAGGDLTGAYPNPQIATGVIVDADVNASAAIAQSKVANLVADLAAKLSSSTAASTYLPFSGGSLTGFLSAHADPTNPMHLVTKQYADLASQGFTFKSAVRAVSTTNVTQSGLPTVDGVTFTDNQRVLCAGQTDASQNGIWNVHAGAWTRATDMDATGELADGTLVPVAQGTTFADTQFICTSIGADPWVPGSSTSTWTRYSATSDLTAGTGLTRTGNSIDFVAGDASLTVNADNVIVASAPRWTTGRTITLTGDVTGASAAFDGTGNLSFATSLGSGVIVDADVNGSAAIAQSKIANLTTDLAAKVPNTRQVIAGAGTTGGGALSGDVTLNVVSANADMTVAADSITINAAPRWSTARSITLTGDVTGTAASVDGSANVSIATTLVGGAAPKFFAGDVGAGTSVTITHNLNTRDVAVTVYRNSGNYDTVMCDVQRPTVNTVTLVFASAVTASAYRCVVQGR